VPSAGGNFRGVTYSYVRPQARACEHVNGPANPAWPVFGALRASVALRQPASRFPPVAIYCTATGHYRSLTADRPKGGRTRDTVPGTGARQRASCGRMGDGLVRVPSAAIAISTGRHCATVRRREVRCARRNAYGQAENYARTHIAILRRRAIRCLNPAGARCSAVTIARARHSVRSHVSPRPRPAVTHQLALARLAAFGVLSVCSRLAAEVVAGGFAAGEVRVEREGGDSREKRVAL